MCVFIRVCGPCVYSWHCKTQTQNFHSGRAPRVDFSQPLGATSPTSAPLHPLSPPTHTHRGTLTHTHTSTQSAPCSLTCYFRFRIRFVCCRRRNLTKSHVANASSSRSLARKALRGSIRRIRSLLVIMLVIILLVGILCSASCRFGSRWQHPFAILAQLRIQFRSVR